jgi:hypothetical protein
MHYLNPAILNTNLYPYFKTLTMKKTILSILWISTLGIEAQNPTPILKNNTVLTLIHKDYSLSNKPDVNSKTKDAEREKLVDEFNEKVLAGTMKYFSKAPVIMEISNESKNDNFTGYRALYKQDVIGGSGCKSTNKFDGAIFFAKDTTFYAMHAGPYYISGYNMQGKFDTMAMMTFPILKYPTNIKVGDILPISKLHYLQTPQKSHDAVVRSVVSGYKRSTSIQNVEVQKFGIGNGNYGYENNPALVTAYEAVYAHVPVEVESTIKMGLSRIFNVGAAVTHTESIDISGKKYVAYVIRSEEWNGDLKSQVDVKTYASEQASVSSKIAAKAADLEKRRREKVAKKVAMAMNQGAENKNDMGFTVMYEDRWYVPELGLEVKKIRYNKFGLIEYILEPQSLTTN